MSKIVYITAKTPFGLRESFVLTEMLALKKAGADLLIIPRDKSSDGFGHKKAELLFADAIVKPLIDFSIFSSCLNYFFHQPLSFFSIIYRIAFKAPGIKIALKNLAVLPKSIYFAAILSKMSVAHIHAHWASTTSTMAYIISIITGIPWSFTSHRWDIPENNLLKGKCQSADFVRAIDENGRQEIVETIKEATLIKKLLVIHMGVVIPERSNTTLKKSEVFKFLCPADFVLKKGHKYLFEACRILSDRGVKYKCLIAGDGPLEDELREMVKKLKLDDSIEFLGRLPHEKLFDLYGRGEIQVVVLPSIVTEDAEKEGIPVALMEAMSFGIPVISTKTGGIPELIGDGRGIMIDEKKPEAIASAIEKLMNDEKFYSAISLQGRKEIIQNYSAFSITNILLKLFAGGRCG
jgi:glycosyltransferase involved in cell wall biosynthesis